MDKKFVIAYLIALSIFVVSVGGLVVALNMYDKAGYNGWTKKISYPNGSYLEINYDFYKDKALADHAVLLLILSAVAALITGAKVLLDFPEFLEQVLEHWRME